MGKKYLETKKDTLESSVLGVWKAAIEEGEAIRDAAQMTKKEPKLDEKHDTHVDPKDRDELDSGPDAKGGSETAKKMKRAQEPAPGQMAETNKNDKSDDGEGLDAVQPKAVKKKFKDRKDRDIDNDGDVDDSDKFLHKRRKAVSKAIAKEEVDLDDNAKEYAQGGEFKVQSMKAALASIWGMEEGKNPFENKDKTEKGTRTSS